MKRIVLGIERLDQSARLVQSELDQLAEELGYLPLALEQAAAYIDQNQASAADYLRLFQTRRRALWATTEPPDDYHATIATTWDIGFTEARQTPGAADCSTSAAFWPRPRFRWTCW
jgi:hypothetical protein